MAYSILTTHLLGDNAGHRWIILLLAWLLYFVLGMMMSSLSPFIKPIIEDLKFNYSEMGTILSAWQLTYIVVALFVGILIDKLRMKTSLALGLALIIISGFLRTIATSFETMFVAVAILGLGGPLLSIGLPKLVTTFFTGRERGTAMVIYLTGITSGGAVTLATANSILLPLAGTWRSVFYLYTLFGTIVLVIWMMAGKDDGAQKIQKEKQQRSTFESLRALVRNRNVWLTIIIGISSFFLANSLRAWLPTILQSRGMPATDAGLVASIYTVVGIPGSLVLTGLANYIKSRKQILIAVILLGALSLLPLRSNNDLLTLIVLTFNGFLCAGVFPLVMLSLVELPEVGSAYIGSAVGIFYTLGEIGGFSGPVLIGYLRDLTGSFVLGIDMLVITLVAMIPLVFSLKEANT